jgi:hypothetical protein
MNELELARTTKLIEEVATILGRASDEDVGKILLQTSSVDILLRSILDPRHVKT